MTTQREPDFDVEFFTEHFTTYDDTFAEQLHDAIPYMLERCPVTYSDRFRGAWVVSRYSDVAAGLQDWRTFSSVNERQIVPLRPGQPIRPPIDLDPPLQREFRRLLNPFLTPARIAPLEAQIREFVTALIDEFVERGSCEFISEFARALPARMLYRLIFGIDDKDVPKVQEWLHAINYQPADSATPAAEEAFVQWIYGVISERRVEPRRDDLIDALLWSEVNGTRLGDDEVMGTLYILVQGGFATTADASGSAMMHLAERPDLQRRLRAEPGLIDAAVEEVLRLEAPVAGRDRLCTRNTTIREQEIAAGERAFFHIASANRDPEEFDAPDELDIDRASNRHLSFGLGPHRCIGSNVARLNLCVSLEELLGRLGEFRITPGESVRREAAIAWGPAYLPLEFAPGRRST